MFLVVGAPGLSKAQWYATSEPNADGPLYSSMEMGEAVKLAVTDKFMRMVAEKMAAEK